MLLLFCLQNIILSYNNLKLTVELVETTLLISNLVLRKQLKNRLVASQPMQVRYIGVMLVLRVRNKIIN